MVFLGLPLATLFWLGGAMTALTALLYVLKLRRRPFSVPFSPIWQRVLKDQESTQLFAQLKRWLSLLLQLALVALLVLALGDPRLAGEWAEGRHVVVLVDTSASMQAEGADGSRIEQAKRKVNRLIDGLSGSDRMLVAQLGANPLPLSTMTDEVGTLKDAVEAIEARDTGASLERGLRFATDSLRDLPKPHIVVVSDGAFADLEAAGNNVDLDGITLNHVPVGEAGQNVAITEFSVRRYPLDKSRYEVLLEVSNFSDRAHQVELTLHGDGQTVDVTRFALQPNERLPRFYQDLAGASRTLEAEVRLLDATDALAADNRAYALMPERRRIQVLVVSPGNTYLEAALLLDEYLQVQTVTPDQPLPQGPFDVTILDNAAAKLRPEHGSLLYLNPPAEGTPVQHRRPIENFGFDSWERKSPLLRWIAMENIQVMRGHSLEPTKGDQVVGASVLGPILVAGARQGQRFVALGFDPRDSDLVLRVAWPLLLLNTINHFADEDSRYLSSFRTGEVWNVATPNELKTALLVDPSDHQTPVPVKAGYATFFGERAGFYELRDAQGQRLNAFAANLVNPHESELEVTKELTIGQTNATQLAGFTPGVRRELWVYLVLAAILLSFLEWFSYHRRLTV